MLEKWVHSPSGVEERTAQEERSMQQNKPALDRGVISALRELGGDDDPGLFAELVELFLEDTPQRLRALSGALEQQDPGALERAAHALKSSAANLGALALSELFKELEAASRERDLERAASLVARSNSEFQRVEAALRSELH
jgi:HPt (histidine-containing phosphotransfer) domain-containing protein